jgi:hypothetical protein
MRRIFGLLHLCAHSKRLSLRLPINQIDEETRMIRFKFKPMILALGVIAPFCSNAADYCIAVNHGFGQGGTTFVGKSFALPSAGGCLPWAGFLKTASTVVAFSSGTGCRSTDGKVLEFTISSTDPSYIGSGVVGSDHIKFCPGGSSTCPFGGGTAIGTFSNGSAKAQTCTSTLTKIPSTHD